MKKCISAGRIAGRFVEHGAELEDDDPAVVAMPDRFADVPKPAKKAPAKKQAATKPVTEPEE